MRVCKRCLMDETAASVVFDDEGVCNYCRKHDLLLTSYPQDENERRRRLDHLLGEIKRKGYGKRYDCIVGISGGTDSTYTLKRACEAGLRPLAVFFDNGWSTEISVSNIHHAVKKLGVDLFTYVVNWEEFRELQVAFLKASVPCVEVPTDVAIMGTLYRLAKKEKVSYILSGASFITEGIVPIEWSYIDGTYVKSVNRKFGKGVLRTYPNLSLTDVFINTFIRRIRVIPFTNYFDYDKAAARKELEASLDWKYYGGHHYENIYSHWAFGWYTLKKFGFDKRKVSLSGPLRMGRISREDAQAEIASPPEVKDEVTEYVRKKLLLGESEMQAIIEAPNKSFRDYRTSYNLVRRFRFILRAAIRMGLIPEVAYYKYFD